MDEKENALLKTALLDAVEGNALLIVGSGFSSQACNKSGNYLPTGEQLRIKLIEELGKRVPGLLKSNGNLSQLASSASLPKVTTLYSEKYGEEKLFSQIKSLYSVVKTTKQQQIISDFRWQAIYTTNYDSTIELSGRTKNRTTVVPTELVNNFSPKNKIVVHINGSVEKVTSKSINTALRLTNPSYVITDFLNSEWASLLNVQIRAANAVFIVGLSLDDDLDLRRILTNPKSSLQNKVFLINGSMVDPFSAADRKFIGVDTGWTINKFSKELLETKKHMGKYSNSSVHNTPAFSKVEYTPISSPYPTADQVNELIYFGTTVPDMVNNPNYLVERKQIRKVSDNFPRCLLVESHLGNGKTIFLKQLAQKISANPENFVYWYKNYPDTFQADLNYFAEQNENFVIIIDDYYNALGLLKKAYMLPDNIRFVLSGRTPIVNQTKIELEECFKIKDNDRCSIRYIDLDPLDEDAFSDWKKIIQKNEFAGASNLILKKNSSLANEIFKLQIESSPVKQFEKLYRALYRDDRISFKIISILLINILLNSNIPEDQIFPLFGASSNQANIQMSLDEFLVLDSSDKRFRVHSATLARFLLHKLEYQEKMVVADTINEVLKRGERLDHEQYLPLMRDLVSFSNLKEIFGKKDLSKITDQVYEKAHNTHFAEHNQFFWLQYAIQKMGERNWTLAKRWLDRAYDESPKEFDLYQINTSQIRWNLESIEYTNLSKENMALFMERMRASSELVVEINRNDLALRQQFKNIDRFKNLARRLTESQKSELSVLLAKIAKHLELPDSQDNNQQPIIKFIEWFAKN
ncbi:MULTISPECIES: SIR2 family protein [Lacticaseibacillus]|uniref:SIR2 family protein n=1 Tax=Lacticaseibacillus TaxID=2759736 RepID=UPI0024B1F134|nr:MULTISPECIES: SIR2 family protein [Lacticaseibacillus]MDM7472497.1 SIR2 family protein [Lacticaseibacillus paracasei]WHM91260.1 SIR2 family protein [Lacticaseibacillus rhamnosus]